jgi:heavy metal sensor kinase
MKSIRLSLMVYFLALLGAALAAVSVLVYQTAHQALLAKKDATRQLLEKQCDEQCKKETDKQDDMLLYQAQAVAGITQFHVPPKIGGYFRHREQLSFASTWAAFAGPNFLFTLPAPLLEGTHGPIGWEMCRQLGAPEITFDDTSQHQEGEGQLAEYFQVNSLWAKPYYSQSLAGRTLPFNPQMFSRDDQVLNPLYDDVQLKPGLTVRRVMLLVPLFGPRPKHPRPSSPGSTGEAPPRPGFVVHCAADRARLEAALAGFREERDAALAGLDAETDDSLVMLRNRLLAISLITFAAIAVGGFCLVRVGLAPLRRLSHAVSQVSEKDFRLPLDRRRLPCELTGIVERLTQTLTLLERAFAHEKQAAADISHELRTPLAALLTTIDVGLRKPRSPAEYRELLEECRGSGRQMSRLVERLLILARLDAGVDRVRPQTVDAADLAEQCAALVRPLAEARGLRLRVHNGGPAELKADPDKLREVLTNLLHNAIEYNRPEGSVDLAVARSNGHLCMEVRDTGIGIPPEAQAHLFERFYRADPSRHSEGMHAGLGLAIVKGYVDLMGGSIAVESKEGQGSTFRVKLPA